MLINSQKNSCPLCGEVSKSDLHSFHKDSSAQIRYSYISCRNCKVRYVDPLPDAFILSSIYRKESYHDVHYRSEISDSDRNSAYVLLNHLRKGSSIADYGCGVGNYMLALAELGFDVHGIELNNDMARATENNTGHPVYTVEDFWNQNNLLFDAIHLGDVLEHLPNPREMLVLLSRRLKDNGVLFIEGPLEINPSIVNFVIGVTKFTKNTMRLSKGMDTPPSHLFMTNSKQLNTFLEGIDWNLEIVHNKVFDSGWPYSKGGVIKRMIASISRSISQMAPFNKYLGNRFSIILKVRNK